MKRSRCDLCAQIVETPRNLAKNPTKPPIFHNINTENIDLRRLVLAFKEIFPPHCISTLPIEPEIWTQRN